MKRSGAFSVFICGVYLFQNVLCLNAQESNFWAERRRAASQRTSVFSDDTSANAGSQLMAQLPKGMGEALSFSAQAAKSFLDQNVSSILMKSPDAPAGGENPMGWLEHSVLPYGVVKEARLSKRAGAFWVIYF
jgi:hypothetical protein